MINNMIEGQNKKLYFICNPFVKHGVIKLKAKNMKLSLTTKKRYNTKI